MFSVIKLILFLALTQNFSEVYGEESSLYKRLFDEHYADSIEVEEILPLLKQIEPLLPEASGPGVRRSDAQSLIKAGEIDEARCLSPELFYETYKIINRKGGWNLNIQDYLESKQEQQVAACIKRFLAETKKISKDDEELMAELLKNQSGKLDMIEVENKMLEVIEAHVSEAGLFKMIGFVRDQKVKEEIQKFSDTCSRIKGSLEGCDSTLKSLILENSASNDYHLYKSLIYSSPALVRWINYDRICNTFIQGKVTLTKVGDKLYDKLVPMKEILAKKFANKYAGN